MGKIRRLLSAIGRGSRRAGSAIAARIPTVARDLSGLAGAGLVSYGMWLIYAPYGFITGGILLLAGAFLSAKAS